TTFLINVSNPGTGPATNVLLKADFDAGLSHETKAGKVELALGTLQAAANQTVPLTLRAVKTGSAGLRVQAVADGTRSDHVGKRSYLPHHQHDPGCRLSPISRGHYAG